jgi:hypothetical protein
LQSKQLLSRQTAQRPGVAKQMAITHEAEVVRYGLWILYTILDPSSV